MNRRRLSVRLLRLCLPAVAVVASAAAQPGAPPSGHDRELRQAAERLLQAADAGDAAALARLYAPAFVNVRMADDGGFAVLTRQQLLSMFPARPIPPAGVTAPAVPVKESAIHHVEIVDSLGFVLLTRVKDLGRGWEQLSYTLVWRDDGDGWKLIREYVHQRSSPRFSK